MPSTNTEIDKEIIEQALHSHDKGALISFASTSPCDRLKSISSPQNKKFPSTNNNAEKPISSKTNITSLRGHSPLKQHHKFLINIPLWGDHFIKKFSKNLAPTLFSVKNMSFLRRKHKFLFVFCTDPASAEIIRESLAHFELCEKEYFIQELFTDNFVFTEDKYSQIKYSRVTESQNFAMGYMKKADFDIFVPLYGDFLIPDDFFERIIVQLSRGYNCWLSLVPPLISDRVERHLRDAHNVSKSGVLKNSDIFQLTKQFLHPLFYKSIIGYCKDYNPVGPYIGFGEKADFVIKSIHYHPIYLSNELLVEDTFNGTIDENLIPNLNLDPTTADFNNTDDFHLASLMDRDFPEPNHHSFKPIEFFCIQLDRSPNLKQTLFLLSNTRSYCFDKRADENLVRKIDNFLENLYDTHALSQGILKKILFSSHRSAHSANFVTRKLFAFSKSILKFTWHLLPKSSRQNLVKRLPISIRLVFYRVTR